jgi:hemolysin III
MDLSGMPEPVSALTHLAGFAGGAGTSTVLARRHSSRAPMVRLSLLLFGLSLMLCFGASSLYHGVPGTPAQRELLRRIDHAGILVLIAGTYTPIAVTLLTPRQRRLTLLLIWGAALLGCLGIAAGSMLPTGPFTILTLLMGWGGFVLYRGLARSHSHRFLRPLLAGGIFYSIGAALNVAGWPTLWPGWVGPHEVFHTFVLAGAAAHVQFVARAASSARAPQVELPRSIRYDAPASPPRGPAPARSPRVTARG